jgi:redox-regulated HSP33 family molecular chaperone
MKTKFSLTVALAAFVLAAGGPAVAKLPAPTDEQKAKAEEAKAKQAEAAQKSAELLCKSMDQVAARWAQEQKAKGAPANPMAVDCKGAPVATAAAAVPAPAPDKK